MNRPAVTRETPQALVLEEGLPFAEVEQRIGTAWAAAGLRHRVVAFYLQQVDARGLYQLAGFNSTVRYGMARYGMSRREARELLAAGKALQDLPLIDDAFAEGELCWSKVRELVKVAVAQHEQRWLDLARQLPIDRLTLEVRLAKAGEPPRDRDDRKGLPEVRLRLDTAVPPDVYAKLERARRKVEDESGRKRRQGPQRRLVLLCRRPRRLEHRRDGRWASSDLARDGRADRLRCGRDRHLEPQGHRGPPDPPSPAS
jgi:hypothetical protein